MQAGPDRAGPSERLHEEAALGARHCRSLCHIVSPGSDTASHVRAPGAWDRRETVGQEVRMEAAYVILPAVALTVYAALMAVAFG